MNPENRNGEYITVGDDVFGIDDGFEPAVQRGTVVAKRELENSPYNELDVQFDSDPMNAENDEPRVLGGFSTQFIRVDASASELTDKLGFPRPE